MTLEPMVMTTGAEQRGTVGFAYTTTHVLLLKKKRGPDYVRNRWNGIGGKIELGESPVGCMRREGREEAALDRVEWFQFNHLVDSLAQLWFYAGWLHSYTQLTDEPVALWPHHNGVLVDPPNIVPNLLWLVPQGYYYLTNPEQRWR